MTDLEIPGMIRGEPNSVYHGTDDVGCSKSKDFLKRPSLYKKSHVDRLVKHEWTDALRFGSGLHFLMEGEEEYAENCHVFPEGFTKKSDANKDLWNDVENVKLEVPIKFKEDQEIRKCRASIMNNPLAVELLRKGEAEVTWRVGGDVYGMQARTDFFNHSASDFSEFAREHPEFDHMVPSEGEPYACDYKTGENLEDWNLDAGYKSAIYKFGYDYQVAFYLAVVNCILMAAGLQPVTKFYFIVCEKSEPMETAVFLLDLETISAARARFNDMRIRIEECYTTGNWPGFPQGMITGISERVRNSRA